jgi:8-oxo-dGTP pyrophosphatase MutT (NUDIX family)
MHILRDFPGDIDVKGQAPQFVSNHKAWTARLSDALVGNETKSCQAVVDRLRRWGRMPPGAPMPAAVLVAILDGSSGPGLLLTRRHDALAQHPGQVAFPGGAEELGDTNPEATALREAEEEVALARARVQVLGRLPRYPTTTGYLVTPIVGYVADPPRLIAQADEVAAIFIVPLPVLLDPARWLDRPLQLGDERMAHRELHWRGQRIWGATAGMLQLLLPPLRESLREPHE